MKQRTFKLKFLENMFVDEPEKLCYNENSNSGIVENCPSLRRIFAVFETYREILQLIGKMLEKTQKLLYN